MPNVTSIVPPRTPSGRLAVAEGAEDPLNEDDLLEAFNIATGDSLMLPERRHLIALAKAWDEAIDLSAALLGHADITARGARRESH